jgi:hypothetical protein
MYHLQLRQFPNHATRFNLSEQEVRAVLEPWARQQIVVVGEQRWAPERATLTVLQGPKLELAQMAMGRGWSAAERSGEDVTERMLAAVAQDLRNAAAAPSAPAPAPLPAASAARAAPAPGDPLALAVQLASLLGSDPERLLAAWRDVASRASGLAPSEALALAERQLARPSGDQD